MGDGEETEEEKEDDRHPPHVRSHPTFSAVVVPMVTDDGGDEKDLILEPGEHCLPFSCRLLPNLPSSFEGQHGCVRYVAKAIVEQTPPPLSSASATTTTTTTTTATTTTKSDVVVARRSFTMAPGFNLCLLPEAAVSRFVSESLSLACGSDNFTYLAARVIHRSIAAGAVLQAPALSSKSFKRSRLNTDLLSFDLNLFLYYFTCTTLCWRGY